MPILMIVEDLVKYIRSSGGPDVAGIQIPAIAMKRIKIACYAARYIMIWLEG